MKLSEILGSDPEYWQKKKLKVVFDAGMLQFEIVF